ncbi:unnamed protein product [Lasius platythorax]|uniref:Uncharacterized protein n=1 Tax=Lasius platythorax TaxID=488582 RepID=A0AAV2NDJ4_9HYME
MKIHGRFRELDTNDPRATTTLSHSFCGSPCSPQRTHNGGCTCAKKAKVGSRWVSLGGPRYPSGVVAIACPHAEDAEKEEISILYQIVRGNWHLSSEHHRSFAVDGRRHAARHARAIVRDRDPIPDLSPCAIVRARPRISRPKHTSSNRRHSDDSFRTVDREERFYCRRSQCGEYCWRYRQYRAGDIVCTSTIRKSVTGLSLVDGEPFAV